MVDFLKQTEHSTLNTDISKQAERGSKYRIILSNWSKCRFHRVEMIIGSHNHFPNTGVIRLGMKYGNNVRSVLEVCTRVRRNP